MKILRLSNYKTVTILTIISLLIFFIVNVVFIVTIKYFFQKEAITNAKDKAALILDQNLSIHDYFTNELKPSLFTTLKDTIAKGDYFEPSWMSSSHAVKNINDFFRKRNDFGYYYKDATIDARNPKNEADSLEAKYLHELSRNPDLEMQEGIIKIDQEQYYYLLKKGEQMVTDCLRCHDVPEIAPRGLIKIYGKERSFHRKVDDIISVVSIRIPIDEAYSRTNFNILILSIILSLILVLSWIIYLYLQRKLVTNPIESLNKQALAISLDNSLLGKTIEIDGAKDLTEFVHSFNVMSHKLYEYNSSLEEKIKEKTIELERKIEEVNQINHTKDKFFSIIAHDLKSPFNSLIGLSKLLMNAAEEGDTIDVKKLSSHMHQTTLKTYDLLLNLLEWSLSQTEKIEFRPEKILFFDLVEEVCELLQNQADEKKISILNKIPKATALIGDKNMLRTIIRNLVSNGIKYTKQGTIAVSCEEQENQMLIEVSDTGIGLSEKRINELFLIDYATSTPGTEKEKGTGLGLILCKEFVDKHQGKIWVESAVGKGSVFKFILPQSEELSTENKA